MAQRFDITESAQVFAGERKNIRIDVVDASGNPYNMTGKTLEWVIRKGSNGPVVLTKSGAAITLTNNAGTNDRAIVALDADDTVDGLTDEFLINPGRYSHALRQADAGDEAILSYGDFVLGAAAAR